MYAALRTVGIFIIKNREDVFPHYTETIGMTAITRRLHAETFPQRSTCAALSSWSSCSRSVWMDS
jgi:hypothetical protein